MRQAAEAAQRAFMEWRETPPPARAQYLFSLKSLLEEHKEEVARIVTQENGKCIAEARGEVRRAIENIEVATGVPSLMMGYNLEDIARNIDEDCIRQPLGAFCGVVPFNFPAMVALWFMPYAIACGNTYIVKPSEQVPLTLNYIFDLLHQTGIPKGVVNLVNGAKDVVDALLESPEIKGVSFVGSTPVAKYVYGKATEHGKRGQCQGWGEELHRGDA